jgi:hypothetical protein
MHSTSEDVTGAPHAATQRLRLNYRITALESPVYTRRVRHIHSGIILISRCTVRRMRNKAELLYSYVLPSSESSQSQIIPDHLPKSPARHHLLFKLIL